MKGFQTHTITIGDSLQKLARMYDVANWEDIAEINKLSSPYIDSTFPCYTEYDGKVLKVGDTILIPSQKVYNNNYKKIEQREIETLAYGSDLSLYNTHTPNSTFKGYLDEGTNDVLLVDGLDNLAQQLETRLTVKKGALLLHPKFGSELYKYVGAKATQENMNKIIFETESCLRSDFRVLDVEDIKVEFKDGYTAVTAFITPIRPARPFSFTYYIKEGDYGV